MEQIVHNKPIVIIDSCIIKQDRSCSGGDMKLFAKLSSIGLLEWYIPWIVYKEVTSSGLFEGIDAIGKVSTSLTLLKKLGQTIAVERKITEIEKGLSEIKNNYSEYCTEYWNRFLQESNATMGDYDKDISLDVFESYFSGGLPYQQPKNRKDIPDSFIFEEIKKLSQKNQITFISCDNNLFEKSKKIVGVKSFTCLKDFFDSEDGRTILQKYEQIEQYNHCIDFILQNSNSISSIAKEDVVGDLLVPLGDSFINAMIPSDDNEGRLISIPEITDITISTEEIKYVDGTFFIPILAECFFEVEYLLYKSDYPLLEDRVINIIDNDWNKYYYLVSEVFEASFMYNYSIEKTDIESRHLDLHILDNIEQLTLTPLIRCVS